ncbi:emp24/gp25L/p24 family/GOLD, putative [Trypanosoma equiperdum]|uniref:GOLD domain-containing protein n=2 Tax=Trypanozoon TaxID=39700 RepID=Q57YT0_TRYB2|nr:hypothetical protein, conserved [Trypanosoma brucei brucei TREU927]AAX69234.1 hypothetical protein, conserved [Trypanosoma brucei]AAZ13491.1 hypothetical protein, conserved [Trypanosoma brucei brucei TREU927]SCU65243.1 emp24/gp25L/p24 family/GOLD, putative [Trypanosoma equiperdum]
MIVPSLNGRLFSFLFIFLTVGQLSHPSPAEAFATKIEPHSRECFVESVPAGASLAFLFRVTDGGSFDIDAVMTATTVAPLETLDDTSRLHFSEKLRPLRDNAQTTVINEWRRATEGSQTYTAPTVSETKHGLPAEVTVCFDNSFARRSPKWVSFQFLRHEGLEEDPQASMTAEAKVEAELHKHGSVLFELATATERLRLVGESDRVKHESLARIIQAGLIGNIVLLAVMAVYQYRTLTRFLLRCKPQ